MDRVLFTGKPWTERCSPAQSGALSGSAPTLSVGVLPGASRPKRFSTRWRRRTPHFSRPTADAAPRLKTTRGSTSPQLEVAPGLCSWARDPPPHAETSCGLLPLLGARGFLRGLGRSRIAKIRDQPAEFAPSRAESGHRGPWATFGPEPSPRCRRSARGVYIYIYIYIYAFWARRLLLDVAAPGFEVV